MLQGWKSNQINIYAINEIELKIPEGNFCLVPNNNKC